ncbi:tRNA (adenosine(37)-N6)-threonylcarbamoyltransferase complex dimerization subunit type 1 TsaB [Cyclobacterium jeungdonense]|uniref:tRNA (Adenosine(37)-N6)-threonylcarbamoyltransferase complex dimerization subunit type 1 TsaB n=1 Tax=Cyclobacterium jeungdonense TaxID=708087 RepID=A0ABT8CBT0_9BACT|nr:tRNA (adenosine(37)-N6)-threonylcarbamoyltransferase complex dimerization subunit type 1 TsaB [Cyclobacterium jeungdonense]MDN3689038.1 tRNA (adenosine(37)-N6)-threonylcarbamoyltransferase complex dimerization subunit type 1 TsaB [Cyclobacterium jeungdonense]
MSLLLSIDTSIDICSVALHDKGRLRGLMELHQGNIHGNKLVPCIKSLMDQSGYKMENLDAIAVAQGPGSYTGLRIGVATAKGLAFAHDLPLIGVDSLDALGRSVSSQAGPGSYIIPMIDARRMEVYATVLDHEGKTLVATRPEFLDQNPFQEFLKKGKVYFLGNANVKAKKHLLSPHAIFRDGLNSATGVGEIAYEKFKRGEVEDIAYFEPNYLKEFMVLKSKKNPLLS